MAVTTRLVIVLPEPEPGVRKLDLVDTSSTIGGARLKGRPEKHLNVIVPPVSVGVLSMLRIAPVAPPATGNTLAVKNQRLLLAPACG